MTEARTPTGNATLTATGVAELANVSRAAVSNWRRRYADFPAPVGGTPASPSFDAHDVEQWLRRQGKLHQAGIEQWAWRHIESHQPSAQIGDALSIAGAYLLARSTQPATGSDILTPTQLSSRLRTVDRDLATQVAKLLPQRWDQQLTTMLVTVDRLAREQDPEAAFEYLHGRYVTSAQSMSGLAGTPDIVADTMLSIAGNSADILDFTCGTGSILRMAADRGATRCYGQEVKPQYALIALLRLWFVHRRTTGRTAPPTLHMGDSLLADAYPDLRVDAVVANFPFGIHDWGHDRLAYDPRWEYGIPPRTEPELAWIQHALAHLSPAGTAVVLMPPAAAIRPAGRRIRAELVRRGALRAVVALPAGLMPPAGIGLHIWVLTNPREEQSDRVLFVDASTSSTQLAQMAATAWREFREHRHTDLPGVRRAVPVIDLLDDQVDLTVQRHLPPAVALRADPAETVAGLKALDRLLTEAKSLVPGVRPAATTALRSAPQASLADLVRAGSMSLLRPGKTQPGVDHSPQVHLDDLLIVSSGRDITVHVASAEQTTTELAPGTQLLRVDPAIFDPWFVAGIVSSTDNLRTATRTTGSGTGTLKIDPRRLTIPVLPLPEQQEFGRTFRQLANLRTTLEKAAATGAELARQITDGLTLGTLTALKENSRQARSKP